MIRRYSELIKLPTLKERFEYLKLGGKVGAETYGWDRWVNQFFYKTPEWRSLRDKIVVRDNGCELGVNGYGIDGRVYIHHMNPIRVEDILSHSSELIDPEFLICCSFDVHQAIHYGNESMLPKDPIIRTKNDTCPWRR